MKIKDLLAHVSFVWDVLLLFKMLQEKNFGDSVAEVAANHEANIAYIVYVCLVLFFEYNLNSTAHALAFCFISVLVSIM